MSNGKVIVVQPIVPAYRVGFFNRLAERLGDRFSVHASKLGLGELEVNDRGARWPWERFLGPLRKIVPGLEWQVGALSIPIERDDVVVVCGAPRCISNLALLAKARWKGATAIWWGHYWSATSRSWRARIRLFLVKISNGVIFYTDSEVKEYLSIMGMKNSNYVFGLNNGIETEEIVSIRRAYKPDQRPRDVFFIGRLTEKSEISLLLRALALPPCKDVTLDIIGSGPDEANLRQLCEDLGVVDRIAWHGEIVNEYRISEIANNCKVFVYPGAVGLSLIHALSYGLPAIVHDNRWQHMPEIAALDVGRNGVLFKQFDVASLAAVIGSLLKDSPSLTRMSSAAVLTTENTYNAEDMANRFVSAIKKIQELR